MALFRKSVPVNAPEDLVLDRCWSDPDLDRLADLLESPDPEPAAKAAAALDLLLAVQDDPERLVQVQDAAGHRLADHLEAVGALVAATPSGPVRAQALALHGFCTAVAAWNVRGGGWASTVGEDAAVVFQRMLEQADEIGRLALEEQPDHAGAGVLRLATARGLGMPSDEWWHRFDVARRARSTLYPAHVHMMTALCQKWYGNHDLMFDFARRTADEAPPGDPVGAVLALAHAEFFLWVAAREDGSKYQRSFTISEARRAERERMAAASDRWLGAGPAAPGHPRAAEAHQVFGWFFQALGTPDPRAKTHLAHGTRRVASLPWSYLGGDRRAAYLKVLAEAKVMV